MYIQSAKEKLMKNEFSSSKANFGTGNHFPPQVKEIMNLTRETSEQNQNFFSNFSKTQLEIKDSIKSLNL